MADDDDYEIYSIAEFPDEIPQARYFRVYYCPSCPNAHIVLFNEEDEPFAQMVIAPYNLRNITRDCTRVYGPNKPSAEVIKFPKN